MMLLVYEILYIIFVLCYLPIFLIRGKYHPGFLMRLGIFAQDVLAKLNNHDKFIWLHTVSVGEAQAASAITNSQAKVSRRFSKTIPISELFCFRLDESTLDK